MITTTSEQEVGTQGSVGVLGMSTPPPIIKVDLINTVPSTSAQDPAVDQAQIEQPQQDPKTASGEVPGSTSMGHNFGRRDIDWNDTPWEGDIFEDDEDMKEVRRAILTLNQAFTINSCL
jgi:hypothetical protein